MSVWQLFKKGLKNTYNKPSQEPSFFANIESELNIMMIPACSFYKRKNVGAQWIYRYTIHKKASQNGLRCFQKYLFKTSV